MKTYILSAGLGTRLYPSTHTIPKVMLPIGKKPVLWYQIQLAKFYGIGEIMINLYKNHKVITDYFGDGSKFGVRIFYSYEKKLLGTAGAVKIAEKFFDDKTFFVIYGDTLRNTNLKKLLDFHKKKNGVCTISLYKTEEPWTQGIVELSQNSQILSIVEKPKKGTEKSNLSNAGVLICKSKIFDHIQPNSFSDFGENVLPNLVKSKKVFGLETDGYIQDIGTPECYQKAKKDFKKGLVKFPFKVD